MKIAVILPPGFIFSEFKPNSIETVVRALNARKSNQDDITIYCTKGAETHGDYKVIEIDYNGSRSNYIKSVCEALKNHNPDIIECHQNVIVASRIARRMALTPTLVYRHNYTRKPKHILDKLRLWMRHKPIKGFILVSEAVLKTNNLTFPELENRSFAIPNPIDSNQWEGDADNKEQTILFSGRAAPEKGLEPLVDALVKILPVHEDWKCVLILGDFDTHKTWAQAQIDKLAPFERQIKVLKSQPLSIVKKEIAKAAISVIPSVWNEPFGLVALEAHAAGCAVISSGTGGLTEASGENALYLSTVNSTLIADALEKLINDKDLRLQLAKNGQDFVATNHNIDVRQAQLSQVRKKILSFGKI